MTVTAEHLRRLIADELPDLIAIRHDLHAHPELRYEEARTSKVVQRELKEAGVTHKAGLARGPEGGQEQPGTGVLGHLPGKGQRAVGLRADMDALPIQEANDLEYRSTIPGRMHACGHDGHPTILIGVARVLSRLAREVDLPRPVSLIFQPAEEGGAGAERMIEDGCLDGSVLGPPVEHMFALHGWPRVPVGMVGTRPGPLLAAADSFAITVKGVGCHAAWPHVGRDPIVAGAAVVTALQTIASRNAAPLESVVVSATQFHGGTADNIIPSQVTIAGTVRTLSTDVQQLARRRLGEIATGIAGAHGCEAEVVYEVGYPPTINDPATVDLFNRVARQALGPDRVRPVEQPVMGGEDFAFYGRVVPSCFFVLGLVHDGQDGMPELHQPTFNFNDDAIATGIEIFCRLALRSDG